MSSLVILRNWFLAALTPVFRWFGKQRLRFSTIKITAAHVKAIKISIRPGDIFLSKKIGEATNLVIDGFFKHGAIYAPAPERPEVVEAIGHGVDESDINEFLYKKDYVKVVRAKFLTAEERAQVAAIAREQIGKPYDFLFDYAEEDNAAFYCFELIAWSIRQVKPDVILLSKDCLGEPTYYADTFEDEELFDTVYDTREVA